MKVFVGEAPTMVPVWLLVWDRLVFLFVQIFNIFEASIMTYVFIPYVKIQAYKCKMRKECNRDVE